VGELVRPLVSVHRIVLSLPDIYRLLDPSVHSVAFSVDDWPDPKSVTWLREIAIRQTVPTKASVEAETSTIIKKVVFLMDF